MTHWGGHGGVTSFVTNLSSTPAAAALAGPVNSASTPWHAHTVAHAGFLARRASAAARARTAARRRCQATALSAVTLMTGRSFWALAFMTGRSFWAVSSLRGKAAKARSRRKSMQRGAGPSTAPGIGAVLAEGLARAAVPVLRRMPSARADTVSPVRSLKIPAHVRSSCSNSADAAGCRIVAVRIASLPPADGTTRGSASSRSRSTV